MKNFSDITIDNTSKRERIIQNALSLSGLPRPCIENLYESAFVDKNTNEIDEEEANKMFKEYFGISAPLDVNIFSNDVITHMKKVGDLTNTPEKRKKYTKDLMAVIKKYLKGSDTPTMLQMLSTILCMKDEKSGSKLMQSINIGNLMESDKFNLVAYNDLVNATNAAAKRETVEDKITSKQIDAMFYDELKNILTERFQDYSAQPIIYRDSYETIMKYVERKSSDIQTSLNIMETDDRRYKVFIDDLIKAPQMNSLYMSVDYLKTITSDLQTMLYDLVIITNTCIEHSNQYKDYIDPDKFYAYNNSLKALLESISSSANSSYVLMYNATGSINEGKYRSQVLASDCLLLIKQIQTEFAIGIRKYINVFFTAAMDVINAYKLIETKLRNTVITNKNI